MTHPALIERITRSLAYMLRHQPEKFDLDLDAHGFGDLSEVVRALNERLGEAVELEDVEVAIAAGDRPRYEIQGERVRALYGHSIDVEPGETARPPEVLYVGIGSRDARRAVQYGLRGGRRRFLHLAKTPEEARETGKRTGREYAVLTVFALDAWEDGVNFYDRQALFLAEQIPTDFLEISGTFEDGFERPATGGRDRGRSDRGRQGGRGDRDSRGDRGPRRERSERSERSERPEAPEPAESTRQPRRSEQSESSTSDGPRQSRRERSGRPPRSEPREERAPRTREPEPKPEAEVAARPAPEQKAPAGGGGSSFGRGLEEERPAPARKPRTERPAAPVAPKAKPPEPEAKPKPEKIQDSGPAFGAGL